jgi:hypothetical protein
MSLEIRKVLKVLHERAMELFRKLFYKVGFVGIRCYSTVYHGRRVELVNTVVLLPSFNSVV